MRHAAIAIAAIAIMGLGAVYCLACFAAMMYGAVNLGGDTIIPLSPAQGLMAVYLLGGALMLFIITAVLTVMGK